MALIYLVVFVLLWYFSGISGFIYWETSEQSVGIPDFILGSILACICGPFTWLLWANAKPPKPPIILFKKRK